MSGGWFCLVWLAVACCSGSADGPGDRGSVKRAPALLVGGETFTAELIGGSSSGTARFHTDNGEKSVPWREIVRWGAPARPSGRNREEVLSAKSVLCVRLLRYTPGDVQVSHPLWGRVSLPARSLRGLVLHPPRLPGDAHRLRQRVLTADEGGDWLLLTNGDTVRCEVSLVNDEEVRVNVDRQSLTLARYRVVAVGFDRSTRTRPSHHGPITTVGWQDGSLMAATSFTLDPQQCEASLVGGFQLKTRSIEAVRGQLNFLRPLGQGVVYLSDLPPHDYRHIALLSIAWPFEKDRNVLGEALRVGGQSYDKGLGMHSSSRVVFDLSGKYRELAAAVALDDAAGQGGSVVFRVYAEDGDHQWRLAWESPIVRGGMRPAELRVDLRGMQRVALVVDKADGLDQRDYANWLEPRLIPTEQSTEY